MVAYWSDTGTLTTKSMLALTNLVSSYPRHGWISGDQAMSPQLAVELARLSEENARLRAQVETLQTSHKPDQNVMLAASRLRRPLLVEVEKASKRFPERYRAMTADPITAKTLGQTSIFDFAFQQPDIFLDGGPEADLDRIFSRYLATSVEHLPEQDGKLHTMALLAMFNFLMRTWGLLEAYNVEAPSSAGTRIQKWVRFSSLGRSGFERATTEFLENAEPAGESDPTPGEAALIRPAG